MLPSLQVKLSMGRVSSKSGFHYKNKNSPAKWRDCVISEGVIMYNLMRLLLFAVVL